MRTRPESIDDYLAGWSAQKRAALEKLRQEIRSAAPGAEECIGYGIPALRLDGKLPVAFGAAAKHCAFYPGAHPIEVHRDELEEYDTSKGTIRFPDQSPLPAALVRKLVRSRIAEQNAKRPAAATRAWRGR